MKAFRIVRKGIYLNYMDGFPSGQRGQTVNLLQIASVVRIHLHPSVLRTNGLCTRSCGPAHENLIRWCGGIGRRKGLKIPRGQPRAGSSPATSSKVKVRETTILRRFSYFFVCHEAKRSRQSFFFYWLRFSGNIFT